MAKKLACVIFEFDENEPLGPENFQTKNGRALGHYELHDELTDPEEASVMQCMAIAHASHIADMKNLSTTFPAFKHEIPAAAAAILAMIKAEQPEAVGAVDSSKFN